MAKLDADSLTEVWRTHLTLPDHWNYPGVMAVLGDGNVYAVAGNLLARVNSQTGETQQLSLPQHDNGQGAAYNGFSVSPDGVIFTKSLERGTPCEQSGLMTNMGIPCAAYHQMPSFLVAVDTSGEPRIITQIEATDFILGRIATERHDGLDFVYCPGLQQLWRYIFDGSKLELDMNWGPVPYAVTGTPGTAPAILNNYVIIQNDGFLSSMEPFTISAISLTDSLDTTKYKPLEGYPMSQVGSKSAVDTENWRIYTADWKAEQFVCLDFNPSDGFHTRWVQPQKMFCFPSLFGDKDNRQIVGTDYDSSHGEQVVWRDAASGEEIVRSTWLDPQFSGSTISPGYNGRFYYLAQTYQAIVELTPVPTPKQQ